MGREDMSLALKHSQPLAFLKESYVLCFLTAASCQAALQAQQLEKWDEKRRVLIVGRRISNPWLPQKNLQRLNRPLLVDRS